MNRGPSKLIIPWGCVAISIQFNRSMSVPRSICTVFRSSLIHGRGAYAHPSPCYFDLWCFFLAFQLECGHFVHVSCGREQLKRGRPTARLTFGFMSCPVCRADKVNGIALLWYILFTVSTDGAFNVSRAFVLYEPSVCRTNEASLISSSVHPKKGVHFSRG